MEDSTVRKVGVIYGIHPREVPAMQLGELLENEGYNAYRAAQRVRRSTNYKRAMNFLGADLLLDLHASSYPNNHEQHVPKTLFPCDYFVTPDIPLRSRRITANYRKALLELGQNFPVFSVSHLIERNEFSRWMRLNSNNNLSKLGQMLKWSTRGWTQETYHRVVTAELWVPGTELESGVSTDALHDFENNILSLTEWMEHNRYLFTCE